MCVCLSVMYVCCVCTGVWPLGEHRGLRRKSCVLCCQGPTLNLELAGSLSILLSDPHSATITGSQATVPAFHLSSGL